MKETYPGDIVSGRFTETVAEKWKVFNLNSVGTEDLGLGRGTFRLIYLALHYIIN